MKNKNTDKIPSLLMLVGLPGCGKSTYLNKHFKNLPVYSSDAIREELTGSEENQEVNAKVFKLLHQRVKDSLKNGISCAYDATNISWKRRKAFLQELNNIPCYKVCHIIATPFEVCLEQNKNRDRVVPYFVIERMYKNFDIPWYNEGWDDIQVVYADPGYAKAYGHWSKFLSETLDYDQQSKWHSETLGDHCRRCAEYVIKNPETLTYLTDKETVVAAGLHDCGKPFCQTFIDSKGEPSEFAHYYNHENVGCYNSLFYDKDKETSNLLVAALIRYHISLRIGNLRLLLNTKPSLLLIFG